jgi:hypothetical protein
MVMESEIIISTGSLLYGTLPCFLFTLEASFILLKYHTHYNNELYETKLYVGIIEAK